MDFDITTEQQDLVSSVRKVLEHECPISLVREVVEKGIAADGLWTRIGELGWPTLGVPEKAGGLGTSFVELVLVLEEFGRAVAPGPFLATSSQFAPVIEEAANPEQQIRFLEPVGAGKLTGTLAIAEATGSWRVSDIAVTARPAGAGWMLDGVKQWVLDGAIADEIVVAARVPGPPEPGGIGLFVVPRSAVSATTVRSFDASRPYATVDLRGVRVEPDRVLGRPGEAGRALERALDKATVALAIEMLGTSQAIFDITLAYARERVQFDRPIGSFQAIQHKFADMLIALEKARSTCYFAAMAIAEDDERRSIAASMAKCSVGDCQRLLAKEGIQIHGGIGYTWEYDIHLFVKRAKAGEELLGNTSDHRARIADLLGV